jgi:hypothetical protein
MSLCRDFDIFYLRLSKAFLYELNMWHTKPLALGEQVPEYFIRGKGLYELLSIGCLILSMLEAEWTLVVMNKMAEWRENLPLKSVQKSVTRWCEELV